MAVGASSPAPRIVAPPKRRIDFNRLGTLSRGVLEGSRQAIERLDDQSRILGVTSSLRGEGRSTIAAGLAFVQYNDRDRRTLLVDLDLDSPSLATRFNVAPEPGLAEIAQDGVPLWKCLRPINDGLSLLTAGVPGNDASRVVSRLGHGFFQELLDEADVVIADLPPLLDGALGLAATRLVEVPLLVALAGETPLARISEAASLLPAPPLVILNGVHSSLPSWARRVFGGP